MRGAVTYEDLLNMSDIERELIKAVHEENLEVAKKSQLPYF